MPELDQCGSPWNEGLGVPMEAIALDLYRLLCIFHASSSIDTARSSELADLRKQFQEAEVGRLLISIAASLRNALDQNPARLEQARDLLKSDKVGSLIPNLEFKSHVKPLSFREACHKIIHCWTLNYDYAGEKARFGDPLLPQIHLYGFKNQVEWKATIEIDQFVDVACSLNG